MRYKMLSTGLVLSACVCCLSTFTGWVNKGNPVADEEVRRSAAKGLSLLEQSGYKFINRTHFHCASCHHATLTCMAVEEAVRKEVPVADSLAQQRAMGMKGNLKFSWDPNKLNDFVTAKFIGPYTMLGMYAAKIPPDRTTDIAVDYMLGQQRPDGTWQTEDFRVPLEAGEIHLASMSIRAIQLYASPAKRMQVEGAVARTRAWLEQANPGADQQQEVVFQLLGLHWTSADAVSKVKIAEKLRGLQNPDGGWSQLPSMKSDAYATGQALYALLETGMNRSGDEVCQKAIRYLLKTQDPSGAWIVETRSNPIQPFFSSDFPPYDENQYISATASNWSVMALLNALPDKSN
jgi:hypothetical protein